MILGVILLLPIGVALFYQESITSYQAFIIPSVLSLILGSISIYGTKNHYFKLSLSKSMFLCTLSWVVVSIISAVPFIIGLDKSFIDAFFEAVSGFTTTGITVFEGLEFMPRSIIFWRSLIQWLGGLGILTFFLFITFRNEGDLWQLFSAESHKINSSRPVPNIYKTIKIFWGIYALFTFIEIILLIIVKVPVYDAIIHSLTSLSTGGFSNYDASIGYYQLSGHPNYKAIEYIITVFMFLGGVNFLLHYKWLTGDFKSVKNDVEFKSYLKIIGVFTAIIIGVKLLEDYTLINSLEMIFRKTIFQIVSLITTTGFGTQDIGSAFFPAIAKQLFIVLMIVGGCVGSTAGGIKVIRIKLLNKLFKREMDRIVLPKNAVLPITLNQTIIENSELFKVAALFFAWLWILIIGSGITAIFSDLDAFQSFSGMASALGNIGPFYFSVSKMASLSPIVKLNFIIGMLAGRLELLPIFILLRQSTYKRS